MSLTLAEAKPLLARSIENGLCASDPRLPDRIHEAVARLHALGDWIGSVERYAVKLDGDRFTLPTRLQNVMRVATCPDGFLSSATSAGALISDTEYALLLESAPVLSVQQVTENVFRVVGPTVPPAVDVMGKVKLTKAIADSDPLAISDVYALKLMLLAIFREEVGEMQAAAALIQQAVGHIKSKTDNSVAEARKVFFTSMASGIREGTLGYARAKLALALTDGLRIDDHKLIELIGEAERRLLHQGREWRSYLFKTRQGILALPREIETLVKVDLDNAPTTLQSHWFEYQTGGWGYREEVYAGANVVHRGEHALHTILPQTGPLTVVSDAPESGLRVVIVGRTEEGIPIEETLEFNGGAIQETQGQFAEVLSLRKDVGVGNIFVSSGNVEVAFLSASETDSRVTWYAIPSDSGGSEKIVRVVARPRWYPKLRDTDALQIASLDALVNMSMSILKEREGDRQAAVDYEARALRFYENLFSYKEGPHARRVQTQKKAFSGRGIYRFR